MAPGGMLVQKSLQKVAQRTIEQTTERVARLPASATDVRRFQAAMQSNIHQLPESLSHSPMPLRSFMPTRAIKKPTLGDAMLKGLQGFSQDYHATDQDLSKQIAPGIKLDAESMIKIQIDMMNLTLMQTLASKVADKASQGIQQLFRTSN